MVKSVEVTVDINVVRVLNKIKLVVTFVVSIVF